MLCIKRHVRKDLETTNDEDNEDGLFCTDIYEDIIDNKYIVYIRKEIRNERYFSLTPKGQIYDDFLYEKELEPPTATSVKDLHDLY